MTTNRPKSVAELKSSPHWRVEIQPFPFDSHRFESPIDAKEFVESRRVKLRGWDIPSFSFDENDWESQQDFWGSHNSHRGVSEYWRIYQSGQFIHLCDIREVADEKWFSKLSSRAEARMGNEQHTIPGCLDFVNLVWTIAEYLEFAARAAASGQYGSSMTISIALKNIKGFCLSSDVRRPIGGPFRTDSPDLDWSQSLAIPEVSSSSRSLTCQCSVFFIKRFGWADPSPDVIGDLRDDLYPSTESGL